MSYISQISVDGGSPLPIASRLYGTCSTLANVSAKVVSCPDFDQLINGVTIRVEFTYSNTAANATLNVNRTGAIPIYQHGTTPVGSDEGSSWKAGSVVAFTYNGSAWMMNGSASPTLSPVATSGSYNDLTDKPVLTDVATSGSYNDLTDKPVLSNVANSGSYNDLTDKPVLSNVATSGSYNDLTDKPVLSNVANSGSYNDLTDKPVLTDVATSGSYNDLTDKPVLSNVATSGSYNDLTDKPVLTDVATSGSYNDLTDKPVLTDVATSGSYNDLTDKPVLSNVATSGSYNDLTDKPVLTDVATSGSYNDLTDKPVLSNVANSGSYNDLTDKPSIPTATSQLTNDSHFATESFVNQAFTANDAMVLKGTLGASGTVQTLPAVHEVGWTYKVATAGTYAGQECEVGDMVICIADGTEASSLDWTVIQTNMQDCVTTDQGVANTGKLMQVDSNGRLVPVSLTVSSDGILQLA